MAEVAMQSKHLKSTGVYTAGNQVATKRAFFHGVVGVESHRELSASEAKFGSTQNHCCPK
jgi:hypothetical protein